MSTQSFAVGDRVKVTQEGVVTRVWSDTHPKDHGLTVKLDGVETTFGSSMVESGLVAFVKMEPPVEVFKPGDVVRSRHDGTLRAIGEDGWINLRNGVLIAPASTARFTSEDYERVNLA